MNNMQGTWSWMSAELVMAGPKQPVVHDSLHDLESFFYVLVRLCVLFEQPGQVKPDDTLAKCFDKLFNTFKPSVLKTIIIQSDLTWHPSVLNHILLYFHPVIPFLENLRREIVIPMYTDTKGTFHHKTPFDYTSIILHIIMALGNLPSNAWGPYKFSEDNQTYHWAKQCQSEDEVNAEIKGNLNHDKPQAISNLLPDREISNDSEAHPDAMPAVWAPEFLPTLPRVRSYQCLRGSGFQSISIIGTTRLYDDEYLPAKSKCLRYSSNHTLQDTSHPDPHASLSQPCPSLMWRGQSTSGVPQCSSRLISKT